MRWLYRALVSLHPAEFRRQFGDEMLWIFDAHPASAFLTKDAVVSLARQWILRTRIWIAAVALVGGLGLLEATSVVGQLARRASSFSSAPPNVFFILAVVGTMCAIIPTLIFCVAWFQLSRRKRHA